MWQEKNGKLYKEFNFKTFSEAMRFMSFASQRIDKLNHHPEWKNQYNLVQVWLTTHEKGGITDMDRRLSTMLDEVYQQFDSVEQNSPMAKNANGNHSSVKLYTDGGSRGNPGPSAIGFVILSDQDEQILKDSKYIGITTNNQAEYQALREGLEACIKMNVHEVDIYMDSLLVVNQMKGIYKVKNRDLWPTYEAIKELLQHFNKHKFTHVPRELNKTADEMVNICLDSATK